MASSRLKQARRDNQYGQSDATYRSQYERKVGDDLSARGVPFGYEDVKVGYTVPAKAETYTPDFTLPNGILIEAKGNFTPADRRKLKLVKQARPDLDIRLLFQRPNNRLNRRSKTTYAAWAEKHGFPWAEKTVPDEWINEPANAAVSAAGGCDSSVSNK